MLQEETIKNKVELIGEISTDFTFSHKTYGENFYSFIIKVKRLSNIYDSAIVTVTEKLTEACEYKVGDIVAVKGQYRSYNNYSGVGNRLILTVFAKEMSLFSDETEYENSNYIYLNGFVCKEPVFRTTPFGREITDLLIAVNRTYNKSDYIPCIAWGCNARLCSGIPVGSNVVITGRIQSREYQKKIDETKTVTKTAYEVSVSHIELNDENSQQGQKESLSHNSADSLTDKFE